MAVLLDVQCLKEFKPLLRRVMLLEYWNLGTLYLLIRNTVKAAVGVQYIWIHKDNRRKGIALRMLDIGR